MTSKREIRRELQRLGWETPGETRADAGGEGVVTVGYGPYRLAVAFDAESEEPTGMVAERVGSEAVYTRKWESLESLPEPQRVIRRLAGHDPTD
jgi:hypothetical protein